MPSSLPQHSYSAFKRYEADIASVVSNYPLASRIDPRPLNTLTYCCRIRDALHGFDTNAFTSSYFTIADLHRIFACFRRGGTFIFTYQDDFVIAGDRKQLVLPKGVSATLPPDCFTVPNADEFDARDEELLLAVCVLKNRLLHNDPLVLVNLSPHLSARITSTYANIQLIQLDSSRYMLT